MPEKLPRRSFDFHQPRYTQISESHCGPAVTQMLLGTLDIDVTQEAVAEMGGAKDLIELNGMRVDQLALAVQKLAPRVVFWWKDHSSLEDLLTLVKEYSYPVGVEWQGLFEDDEEEEEDGESEAEAETGEDDFGHYSIVVAADTDKKELVIADPYKDYISQARFFSIDDFYQRWWDYNEITDPKTGNPRLVKDVRMMFLITPEDEIFPLKLGMYRAYELSPDQAHKRD